MAELTTTYAVDDPDVRDYQFQQFEDIKHEDVEYAEWWGKQRPKDKLTVQNQGNTPACTCFSNGHIVNAMNILEDSELWENRPQVSIPIWWNEFCELRHNFTTWTSIQRMAQFFKNKWLIEWYVTIANSENNIVAKMKKAIDNGNFICSGSSNTDRATVKKTGTYAIRTDKKFVWHWRCYVDYWADYFRALTSRGDKRGIYNGYFKVPFEMVAGTYSKLCMIDKSDGIYFQKLKDRIKVENIKNLAKELYITGNDDVKKYFNKIKLSTNLDNLYK